MGIYALAEASPCSTVRPMVLSGKLRAAVGGLTCHATLCQLSTVTYIEYLYTQARSTGFRGTLPKPCSLNGQTAQSRNGQAMQVYRPPRMAALAWVLEQCSGSFGFGIPASEYRKSLVDETLRVRASKFTASRGACHATRAGVYPNRRASSSILLSSFLSPSVSVSVSLSLSFSQLSSLFPSLSLFLARPLRSLSICLSWVWLSLSSSLPLLCLRLSHI